jgi:hypothetical protein
MDPNEYEALAQRYSGAGEQVAPPELFLRIVAQRVKQTAARLGIPPEVALQKFEQGELPLMGIGAPPQQQQ